MYQRWREATALHGLPHSPRAGALPFTSQRHTAPLKFAYTAERFPNFLANTDTQREHNTICEGRISFQVEPAFCF